MRLRLVSPVKRKGTRNIQFVQRIPTDVRARAAGLKLSIPVGAEVQPLTVSSKADAIRLSLRTSDPSTAKARQGQVAAYVETVWQALRGTKPATLSHRQATALAGELYRGWADEERQRVTAIQFEADRTATVIPDGTDAEPEAWNAVAQMFGRIEEPSDLERIFGSLLDRLLLSKGIASIDPGSREMILAALLKALQDAAAKREKNASGDYSTDDTANRFPQWERDNAAPVTPPVDASALTLTGLLEDWWKEAKAAGRTESTYESYRTTVKLLAAFLGHDDALRVTPANIVAFKDDRLAKGVSAKTVGDSDLSALRSLFGWAKSNQRRADNPTEGIKVTRAKPTRLRSKGFTPNEVKSVLSHSLHHKRGHEAAKMFAAKRWLPWLCAYTGARLGEMAQLRKQDIREENGTWVVTVTPEAGTVKDKEVREVVLHPHLIELGFADYVEAAAPGYLFLSPKKGEGSRGQLRTVRNRMAEFVREVVKDSRVAPNHAWRHLFKTIGREVGVADSVLDAICGHAAKTVGQTYGDVSLRAQREAFARFPKFELGEEKGS
jgi:integrase